jgi:hypothetical protein
MPFTVAHAAAALPLKRTQLVFSAVVIGTMAPDFEYFLRLAPQGRFGHSPTGLLAFTTPLALVVLWLFHRTVKPAILRLSPSSVQKSTGIPPPFHFTGARRFGLIVLSIVTGAVSHVVWDSFTHPQSWLVIHSPLLRSAVTIPWLRSYPIAVFKLLQHASTLLGLGALTVWLIFSYRREKPAMAAFPNMTALTKASIIALLSVLALLGGAWRATSVLDEGIHISAQWLGIAIVTTMTIFWWELVLLGGWWSVSGSFVTSDYEKKAKRREMSL